MAGPEAGVLSESRERGPGAGFEALLAELASGWRRSSARVAPRRRVISIGGEGVALSVAGERLADELHRPFAHLADAPEATVELFCWDAESCGVPVPASPFELPAGNSEETRIRVGDRVLANVHPEGGSISAIDPEARHGYYAVESARHLAGVERAVPLVSLLRLLLGTGERAIAHGAVVARGDRGLLVPAMAGSGKSTLAVAALREGLDLVADDISVVDVRPGQPTRAHGLYCTAKLDQRAMARFPGLDERVVGHADRGLRGPKDVIDLSEAGPGRFRGSVELVGIVVPRIDPTGTRLEPLSGVKAMLALAPTSVILFGTSRERDSMAVMARLVRRLPSRLLLLGDDDRANARAMAQVLEELDG